MGERTVRIEAPEPKKRKECAPLGDYVKRITEMVEARRGKIDAFIVGQIEITANCWRQYDKLNHDLTNTPSLLAEVGSMGQQNMKVNPLFAMCDKYNRTLAENFKKLGLNFDIAPEKVNEADVPAEEDPIAEMMKMMNNE
ncbi:MAG: hypothetical protein LUD72_06195 [Bacteroidales bacterium]|nr:hypothetical protein [Bacteroidales bacterium]